MIVSNLIGGLGNQLFQYACGHAVAQRHGVPLQVAIDQFAGYRLHQGYELARVFAVDAAVASGHTLRERLGPWHGPLARRLRARVMPGLGCGGRACFEPPAGRYWPGIERAGPDAYLHGYWQSERYFETAADGLRQVLRFRQAPSDENARWLERIEGCASVSVHVRRGDYITNPKNRRIYAECTAGYYRAAQAHIRAAQPGARFFVFSDDTAWARQALAADSDGDVLVVDHNRGAASWNDLRLMSRCRHHIVANSSFSWWAAWLGEQPGTIVIAPQRWYVQPGRGLDVVPQRWLRL